MGDTGSTAYRCYSTLQYSTARTVRSVYLLCARPGKNLVIMHAWFAKKGQGRSPISPREKGGVFYLPQLYRAGKDFLLPGTGKHIVGFGAA